MIRVLGGGRRRTERTLRISSHTFSEVANEIWQRIAPRLSVYGDTELLAIRRYWKISGQYELYACIRPVDADEEGAFLRLSADISSTPTRVNEHDHVWSRELVMRPPAWTLATPRQNSERRGELFSEFER